MEKPKTIEEYKAWALENLSIDYDSSTLVQRHRMNIASMKDSIRDDEFLDALRKHIDSIADEYKLTFKAELFAGNPSLDFQEKPFQSIIEKSFRFNCVFNRNFPSPPMLRKNASIEKIKEFVHPNNWYSLIDDLQRCTIVCNYFDGPEFVSDRLSRFCEERGVKFRTFSHQKDTGYYAYHFYLQINSLIAKINGDTNEEPITLEIQISTQFQEYLKALSHTLYENSRVIEFEDKDSWKWMGNDSKFRISYLGHTLHLIEAMIVELRDARLKSGEDKK